VVRDSGAIIGWWFQSFQTTNQDSWLQISPHTIRLVLVHCNQVISSFIMFDHVLSLRFLSGTNNEHLMKRQRTPPSRSVMSSALAPSLTNNIRHNARPEVPPALWQAFNVALRAPGPPEARRQWEQRLVGGFSPYHSEKYEFASWDDDIPNIWKVIKAMFQTTNQLWSLFSRTVTHCHPVRIRKLNLLPSGRFACAPAGSSWFIRWVTCELDGIRRNIWH